MCLSWASSTCSLPSWLRARWAKMSRISPVRSTTRRSSSFSRLRSWPGDNGWLTSTRSAPVASQAAFTSSSLPLPIRVAGFGLSMRALSVAATLAPAERARSANSSSAPSSGGPPAWGWINRAISPFRERSNKGVALHQATRIAAVPSRCGHRPPLSSSAAGRLLGFVVLVVVALAFGARLHIPAARTHAHVARRYHGGDRVLVDHLADGVAQQHDELIEGLDGALQLDAVDEVDGHRDALATQRIQEWILQRLPLGHACSPLDCWSGQSGAGSVSPDPLPVAVTAGCLHNRAHRDSDARRVRNADWMPAQGFSGDEQLQRVLQRRPVRGWIEPARVEFPTQP